MSRDKAINGAKQHLEFLMKDTARLAALIATVAPQRMAILSFASLVPDFPTVRSAFDAALKTFFLTTKVGNFDQALLELRAPPVAKPDSAPENQSKRD